MTAEQQLPARTPVSDDLVWVMDTARFEHMWRISQAMASAKLMPEHLRNSPSDCMLVVEQSTRWGMSPFAVAACTFSVGGKLGYEGKLVAGVINARGNLKHRLSYAYEGDPEKRDTLACTVSGQIQGEAEPRTVRVTWKQGDTMSKGAKDKWAQQPEQQLAYFGARAWARRHMPELLLGIYTPEELIDAEGDMRDVTPTAKKPTAAERRAKMAEAEAGEFVDADGEVHYQEAPETPERADGGAADQRSGEAHAKTVGRPAAPQADHQPPRRGRPPKPENLARRIIEEIHAADPTEEAISTILRAHKADLDSLPEDLRTEVVTAAEHRMQRNIPPSNGNPSPRKLRIWLGPLAQIEAPPVDALGELKAAIENVDSVAELNALTENNGELLRALKGANLERMTTAIEDTRRRLDEPPDDSWQLGDDEPQADLL